MHYQKKTMMDFMHCWMRLFGLWEDLKEFAELNLEMAIDKFGTPLHHVEKAGTYDQCALYEFDDDTGFAVDYDLTTDGDWNDWTLQMEFLYDGDFLKVILSDIHIL